MKHLLSTFLLFATFASNAALINWTNTAGGNWFAPLNWSSHSVPGSSDAAFITNNGTYTVYAATGVVSCTVMTIGGGTGKQTLIYGTSGSFQLVLTNSTVQNNGVLAITNAGLTGKLLVRPGGELQFNTAANFYLYDLALTNQGTLTWSSGSLGVGGSNNQITYITNSGLWQIMGDVSVGSGGGGPSVCVNSGTVKKTAGIGVATLGINVVNQTSGAVDCASGILRLAPITTNFLSGSFVAEGTNAIQYISHESDAGAILSGTGLHQFTSGTFWFRTNTLANLKLIGGNVYVLGTTTFQNVGAITNLTLDGAVLYGTNRVSGNLTVNSGNLQGQLTVLPSGQLNLSSAPGGTQFYGFGLFNQGTVNWISGAIAVGGTTVSNGGSWIITGDYAMNNGGGVANFTNAGTIHKTGGTGTSGLVGASFYNQASGIVEVDTGTIQMPYNFTNTAGTMWLNGGAFSIAFGGNQTLGMTGGSLIGNGTNASTCAFDGGIVSPGNSPGFIQFKNGLTLGTNCTLVIEATGTTPRTQYDQLLVSGAILISNCTLQISSMPVVSPGTTFVIISNLTGSAISGTFKNLPENSQFTISGQPFRIHYASAGNNVTLVRDIGTGGPLLSTSGGGYSNGTFRLSGIGSASGVFTIQATTNFLQWTNIGTATGDLGGNFLFSDTNAAKYRYRFYRTTN